MMTRESVRMKLNTVLEPFGVGIYFQPPSNFAMKYPCLRYEVKGIDVDYASDSPYLVNASYELILITKKPDEEITKALITNIPYIKFDRGYVSNNLYHYVFTCYENMR